MAGAWYFLSPCNYLRARARAHVRAILQTPHLSSSRRLQYSSLICCLLSFSSWSFRWRRDGFTSTTNSGFTFFLYWSRWRRPFMCISLAFGSLNRHSHNLQLKLITLPEKIITIYVTLRKWTKFKTRLPKTPFTQSANHPSSVKVYHLSPNNIYVNTGGFNKL